MSPSPSARVIVKDGESVVIVCGEVVVPKAKYAVLYDISLFVIFSTENILLLSFVNDSNL